MRRIYLLFLLIMLFASNVKSQFDPVQMNFGSGSGAKNSTVCIDVTVQNFVDVTAMQFNISFNANILAAQCPPAYAHPSIVASIFPSYFNCNFSQDGYLNIVWASNPTTIPNDTVIFTLCFDLIGNPGDISPIYLNNLQIESEICQTDMNGRDICTDIINSNIGTITIISNTLQLVASSCDAVSTDNPPLGNISLYAIGGTPPYNFTINPGGFTGSTNFSGESLSFPNMPVNSYTISVVDNSGNSYTLPQTVNINSTNTKLAIDTVNILKPRCVGRRDGRIDINVRGGTAPYKYVWSNLLSGSNATSASSLQGGNYSVTVTDLTGCTQSANFSLIVDTLKVNAVVIDSATCIESTNGIILISANGGNPFQSPLFNYRYRINRIGNTRPFNDQINVTGLRYGDVLVEVQDSLGCVVDVPIFIPYKTTASITVMDQTPILCHGNKGLIQVRGTGGGNVGFQYSTLPSVIDAEIFGGSMGSLVMRNLGPGSFKIIARQASPFNCVDTIDVAFTEPDPIVINASLSPPNCTSFGRASANPSGGVGAYTYIWNPDFGNVSSVDNLDAGTYTLSVIDENFCMQDTSFTFNASGTLSISIETFDVSCIGRMDGRASVNINFSGGNVQTFDVIWKTQTGIILPVNTTTISNLAPGSYTVEVITDDGCTSTEIAFVIGSPANTIVVANITNAQCFGLEGSIQVNVQGSDPNFTYQWFRVNEPTVLSTSNTLIAGAGNYEVVVTSSIGCVTIERFAISEPNKIDLLPPNITFDPRCFGAMDGRATYVPPIPNLNLFWSSGESGLFTTTLGGGLQWVYGIDQTTMCPTDTVYFTLVSPPELSFNANNKIVVNPLCFGDSNGSIAVQAQGGSGSSLKYIWNNGFTETNTLNDLIAGTYSVTVTDENSCTIADTIILVEPAPLIVTLDNSRSVFFDCNNLTNAKLALSVSGGNAGNKTISWQNGVTTEGDIAVNLSSGVYCATITDVVGCRDTFCYTLSAPSQLDGQVSIKEPILCHGGKTCIQVDFITGGTGNNYKFQINNGETYPIDSCVSVFAGTYLINLIDSAGCFIQSSIVINQPNEILLELGEDIEIQLGTSSPTITPSVISSLPIITYDWSPDNTLECLVSDCSLVTALPTENTVYTLVVTDVNGCTARDNINVFLSKRRNVYFPNIFSPNRDGDNDFFQVSTGIGVDQVLFLKVYDKWGNLMYNKENYTPDPAGSDGWDGTFQGRAVDPGVFVYHAKVAFIDGKIIDYTGNVTLLGRNRN